LLFSEILRLGPRPMSDTGRLGWEQGADNMHEQCFPKENGKKVFISKEG